MEVRPLVRCAPRHVLTLRNSPTEKEVFASCSVDKTIKVWDCRRRKTAALSVKAHDADVNVISWNRCARSAYPSHKVRFLTGALTA